MLPTISKPLFEDIIPSTNRKIKLRPFMVGEEKILLNAKETKSNKQMMLALSQVVQACVQDSIDVSDLTVFDIEYLFIKIRAMAVNDVIEMTIVDGEDRIRAIVDINDIQIKGGDKSNKITIGEDIFVTLKYPTIKLIESMPETITNAEAANYLLYGCLEEVIQGEELFDPSQYDFKEVSAWIDENISISAHEEIKAYLEDIPRLYYKIEYQNSAKEDKVLELKSLSDFFM